MSSEVTLQSSVIVIVEDDSNVKEQFEFFKQLAGKTIHEILLANFAVVETESSHIRIIPKKNIVRGLRADMVFNMTKDTLFDGGEYPIVALSPEQYFKKGL